MLINPTAFPTALLAAAFFWIGSLLDAKTTSTAKRCALLLAALVCALPCLTCDLFYTHLFDHWALFYRFRALPFSELTFAGAGLIAGILYSRLEPETLGEKLVAPLALLVLVGLPFSKSALDPVDLSRLQQECKGEVCLQSTMSTCGPSSAATILKSFGRTASERELAKEAFTYRGGTESWYLARALRSRGFDADFVFQSPEATSVPAPSIAGVVLKGGTGHFVAVLDSTPESVVIGDPLVGRMEIKRSDLKSRYRFTGFFLVVRQRT